MTEIDAALDWRKLQALLRGRGTSTEAMVKVFLQEMVAVFIYTLGIYCSYDIFSDSLSLGFVRGLLAFGMIFLQADLNPAVTVGKVANVGFIYILNAVVFFAAQIVGSLVGYVTAIYGLGFSAGAAQPTLLAGSITNLFLAEMFGVFVITLIGAFYTPPIAITGKQEEEGMEAVFRDDQKGRKMLYQCIYRSIVLVPLVAIFAPIGKAPMNVFITLWAHVFTAFPAYAYIYYLAQIVGNVAGIIVRYVMILKLYPVRRSGSMV